MRIKRIVYFLLLATTSICYGSEEPMPKKQKTDHYFARAEDVYFVAKVMTDLLIHRYFYNCQDVGLMTMQMAIPVRCWSAVSMKNVRDIIEGHVDHRGKEQLVWRLSEKIINYCSIGELSQIAHDLKTHPYLDFYMFYDEPAIVTPDREDQVVPMRE